MSKSLGNVSNLLDLIEHYDPRAYRMLLLQSHYRRPVTIGQRQHRCGGQGARRSRLRSPPATLGRSPTRARRRRARRSSARRWTTTSTRRRRWRRVRHGPPGQRGARRRRSRGAHALVAAVYEIADAVGLELRGGDDVPADVRGAGGGARRGARRQGLRDGRCDACRAAGRGWTVETTKDGTDSADDRDVAPGSCSCTNRGSHPGARAARARFERGSATGRAALSPERWATSRASTGCGRCRWWPSCSTTPVSRGCTAGSSASRCSSSCRAS